MYMGMFFLWVSEGFANLPHSNSSGIVSWLEYLVSVILAALYTFNFLLCFFCPFPPLDMMLLVPGMFVVWVMCSPVSFFSFGMVLWASGDQWGGM